MKGPCAPREAVLQLAGRSENWLNEHFTLAGECVPPQFWNRQAVLAASGQRKPGFLSKAQNKTCTGLVWNASAG